MIFTFLRHYIEFLKIYCCLLPVGLQTLSPEDDGFFDLLSKFQGRRIDEQRCSLVPGEKNGLEKSENKENEESKPKMGKFVNSSRTV
jgi:hypothetical protein